MNNINFQALIIQQLSGEISPEDLTVLTEWKAADPANERLANDFALIWQQTGTYEKSFQPDLDNAYRRVQARIGESSPMRVGYIARHWQRVAAAAVLLTFAVWGLQQLQHQNDTEWRIVSASGRTEQITLQDGTKVWLRAGSELHYKPDYSSLPERKVRLTGEAYFEVAHDPARPFQVGLDEKGGVEVLGTAFDVCQTPERTSVLVRSGKVRFTPDGRTQSPVLEANQKAVFEKTARTLKVMRAVSFNELAWQTGGLEFVHTPMSQVIKDLETFYGVEIELTQASLADCPHSAPLTNAPIERVLEAMALVYHFNVENKGPGVFKLTGGDCPK